MKRATLDALVAARRARRPVARVLWLKEGLQEVREEVVDPAHGAASLSEDLAQAVREAIHSDAAQRVETDAGLVFVQPLNPALRLAIVGAVHIAQHLARLALPLGYDVTVIDPRRGFLTAARFPGVALDSRWPDAALEDWRPDARSAVVTLSHDAKIDEPALSAALRSDAFYVGALGSRRTQARRRDRLREAGLDAAALERIHGPVGLDLGAANPAEIALSVAAELTATLRSRGAA